MRDTQTELDDALTQAEGYLVQGEDEAAAELLRRLAEDAEEYVEIGRDLVAQGFMYAGDAVPADSPTIAM